jgi:hypothetical protein
VDSVHQCSIRCHCIPCMHSNTRCVSVEYGLIRALAACDTAREAERERVKAEREAERLRKQEEREQEKAVCGSVAQHSGTVFCARSVCCVDT